MAKIVPFNVFFGDETYLLDRELQRAKGWPNRTIVVLDGTRLSETDVIDALEQPTFDETDSVVVLDNAEKVKLGKSFAAYLEGRPAEEVSSILVALHRKLEPSVGWRQVISKGRGVRFQTLKPWDDDGIKQRIRKEAKTLSLVLDDEALSLFVKVYGSDLGQVVNELQKLTFIVKTGKVTKEHVLLVCSRYTPTVPWDVAEAAMNHRPKTALKLASLLFKNEGESIAVPIVVCMMRLVEQFLVIRSMTDRGDSVEDIGVALKIHPFLVKKSLPQTSKRTVASLADQMKNLCDLETKVKGAAQSKRTLVELAVLSLAA